jgi:hypothetical protein
LCANQCDCLCITSSKIHCYSDSIYTLISLTTTKGNFSMPRITILLSLVCIMTVGGCIAVARRGLGTIIGPSGKMELIEDHGGISPGERVAKVVIMDEDSGYFEEGKAAILQSAIESELNEANLLGGPKANLVLSMEFTKYIDRPAKKVLKLNGILSRDGITVGTAKMTSDLTGYASDEEMAEAIGKASVEFVQRLSEAD